MKREEGRARAVERFPAAFPSCSRFLVCSKRSACTFSSERLAQGDDHGVPVRVQGPVPAHTPGRRQAPGPARELPGEFENPGSCPVRDSEADVCCSQTKGACCSGIDSDPPRNSSVGAFLAEVQAKLGKTTVEYTRFLPGLWVISG